MLGATSRKSEAVEGVGGYFEKICTVWGYLEEFDGVRGYHEGIGGVGDYLQEISDVRATREIDGDGSFVEEIGSVDVFVEKTDVLDRFFFSSSFSFLRRDTGGVQNPKMWGIRRREMELFITLHCHPSIDST